MPNYESEKNEAQKRFDSLPENLKKEMLADKNVQLILSICKDYSIPEDKVKHVALLVGEVFLGYIKPEEIANELNAYFDVDLQKSNFIEIELKQKLFNALKSDLEKIYKPLPAEAFSEEATKEQETAPAVIALGKEAAPITNIPTATPKIEAYIKKTEPETVIPDAPFIIQTKVEAVKPAIPQFIKEIPSLNLKVDPSIIQKSPITKPVPVHLETNQPVPEKKFHMPLIAWQKVAQNTPPHRDPNHPINETKKETIDQSKKLNQPISAPPEKIIAPTMPAPKITTEPKPLAETKTKPGPINMAPLDFTKLKSEAEQVLKKQEAEKPASTTTEPAPIKEPIKQPIQPIIKAPFIESKTEPSKVVHYSNFKTELNNLGLPKKPEPKKEDFINLNNFMRVSGNTVDLRSIKNEK